MRQNRRFGKVPRKRTTDSERDCGGDRGFFPCMHAWGTRWPSRRSQQLSLWRARVDFPSTMPSGKDGDAVLSDQRTLRADRQNRITIYGPKDDGTFLVEFRTADGRVHRAMLEPGARVPPHCLEAVRSRLRAAQVVQV